MMCLGQMQVEGELGVDDLDQLDDEQAIAAITQALGIGRWTAELFLAHQLRRDDVDKVLPAGDLGIRRVIERAWGPPTLPASTTSARWPGTGRPIARTPPRCCGRR